MVTLPLMADQLDNAMRAEEIGIGITVGRRFSPAPTAASFTFPTAGSSASSPPLATGGHFGLGDDSRGLTATMISRDVDSDGLLPGVSQGPAPCLVLQEASEPSAMAEAAPEGTIEPITADEVLDAFNRCCCGELLFHSVISRACLSVAQSFY